MRYRIAILASLLLFIFVFLAGKLAWEQLINGRKLAQAAVIMRSQTIALKEYPRGDILDRNGIPLTDINKGYALFIMPNIISTRYAPGESREAALAQVQALLAPYLKEDSKQEIKNSANQVMTQNQYLVRIASNLDNEEVKALMGLDMQGVMVAPIIKRYREDGFMAHLLGYVGPREDNSGQSGIEKNYDSILANSASEPELVSIVDARNSIIPGLTFKLRQEREKSRGAVVLTIDKRIQEIVENAMNRHVLRGAVVVMDIKNREVLALASRPTFNPYDNIGMIIANDPYSTLTNRALSRYHPGSIFKILVAAAALEEGVITANDYFDCNGVYTFNPQVSIPCLKKQGHGHIDLTTAFTHSCNPSFITIGERLGKAGLMKYVERFHLTDETLLGYVADCDYSYVDIDAGSAALGNACVGQKGVMLTPLQLTSLIATIADQGYWKAPVLVRYTVDRQGKRTAVADIPKEKSISPESADLVRRMMEKTVTAGSGQSAAVPEVRIAGKTGTSQTGRLDTSQTPAREILNVWFGGYFPTGEPRFAVVVLVEDGESGSKDAAPVFRDIVKGMMNLYSMPATEDS
ncbi:MAG: peptidoglycan D,D-transpeptidase FtsI family protein [Syntrophomonadaceae bacterium]